MSGTEDFIEATVIFICAEYGKSIIELIELRRAVPYFSNCEFRNQILDLVASGTENSIKALVVFISAEYREIITNLLELFGNWTVFYFFFERIFCDQLVSAIVTAITAATAGVGALAPSISSGVLVLVLIIIGVGDSLGHDNINLELYWSMCEFVSVLVTVIVNLYKS